MRGRWNSWATRACRRPARTAAWLRNEANRATRGGIRILITHGPDVSAAFAEYSAGMSEGEALVFDPRGTQGAVMIQRIKIGMWNRLQTGQ